MMLSKGGGQGLKSLHHESARPRLRALIAFHSAEVRRSATDPMFRYSSSSPSPTTPPHSAGTSSSAMKPSTPTKAASPATTKPAAGGSSGAKPGAKPKAPGQGAKSASRTKASKTQKLTRGSAGGVAKIGRAQAFSRSGRWRFVKLGAKGKRTEPKPRPALPKAKYYGERVPRAKGVHKVQAPGKLRASITPGRVLIVLAGRFKGKRVVFLKRLSKSGLLLVTGPFGVNGVPLRRIDQAYVIATSASVDVAGIPVPADLDDAWFKRDPAGQTGFLEKRKAVQKTVDEALTKALEKVPLLKEYVGARFSLRNGDAPHLLKF